MGSPNQRIEEATKYKGGEKMSKKGITGAITLAIAAAIVLGIGLLLGGSLSISGFITSDIGDNLVDYGTIFLIVGIVAAVLVWWKGE